jgi:SMC interacting uncharacterized protein involved in chromosome segregation
LRDDVKDLFSDLISSLEFKRKLLNTLLEKEKALSDLIKSNNDTEDDILKIIDSVSALIDGINAIDYNISQLRDEITRKFRLDFDKISRQDHISEKVEFINYRKLINHNKDIIDQIISSRKQNNIKMESAKKELQNQISELERMSKIQIIYPKDLQSS